MRKASTRAVAVILAGFAIGLAHCGSSSSGSSAIAKFGPPGDHFPKGLGCRTDRGEGIPIANPGSVEAICDADAGTNCVCASDADCQAGSEGRCGYAGAAVGDVCSYDECYASNDCASGSTCACGDLATISANVCVPSNCRFDTDCASGYCSPTLSDSCSPTVSYSGAYCHTPNDDCSNDSDCGERQRGMFVGEGPACIFSMSAKKWVCTNIACPHS
jgi:hypothetical protein